MIPVAKFYTHAELTDVLQQIAGAAPQLVELNEIGRTAEDREIWCVTVANVSAGPPLDRRPALIVTANAHATELAGSCASLCLLQQLVEQYPKNDTVRQLLDEQAFFIVPRIAADACDFALQVRNRVRSRRIDVRERDVVYPEDLTGNGLLQNMRWPCDDGRFKLHDKDPRHMLARGPDDCEGPFYEMHPEGLVHEWDGGEVKLTSARSDFNRNYPTSNWPSYDDWIGHGRYPLSESETRAVADFVIAHPNIVAAADLHTGNPAVFYPTMLIAPADDRKADAELIERIGKRVESITSFPYLSSYIEVMKGEKKAETSGTYYDWCYERNGIPGYVLELGMFYNYCGLAATDLSMPEAEHEARWGDALLQWHDAHPDSKLFHDWQPFDHPQLGRVEIGGFDWVQWGNPPLPYDMEPVCERVAQSLIELAQWSPRVVVTEFETQSLGEDLYKVTARLANRGRLATHLTQQGLTTHPHAKLELRLTGDADLQFAAGCAAGEIDHLLALRGTSSHEWVVRGKPGTTICVDVSSPRGVCADAETLL